MQKRFKPDNGGEFPEWEEVCLGDIAEFSRGKGLTKKDIVENGSKKCILYGQLQVKYQTIIKNVTGMTNSEIKNPVLSKSGDVLISSSISAGLTQASCIKEDGVIIGSDINILRPKENIDGGFLARVINANAKKLKRFFEGSVILHLRNENIKKISVKIPKSIEEQQKIAKALDLFDEMIANKREELEVLKELKKTMMKTLFDRTKRFKDENGNEYPEWEEKTLNEICESVSDGSHFSPKTVKNGKMMLSVKDMDACGFNFSNCKRITETDFDNLVKQNCKPQINDVLLSKDGSVFKYVFKVDKEIDAVLLSSIAIIRPNTKKIDSNFLVQCFKNTHLTHLFLRKNTTGTAIQRVVLKNLKNIQLPIPCLEEQQKIGIFLSDIDTGIEIQKEFINLYAEAKKVMMKELIG